MSSAPIRTACRILGIDPGLRRTGWGVIESDGNRVVFVGCGSVEPPEGLPLASRLLAIHEGLAVVLCYADGTRRIIDVREPAATG